MVKKITFDKKFRNFVLESFNKITDGAGYIAEKDNPGQRVLALNGTEVKRDEFAGIRKGSEIFIKSDLPSLIELCDDLSR